MYSLASSTTFAALTIASAASTDPMSPFVSISPSASLSMRRSNHPQRRHAAAMKNSRNSNRLREMQQLTYSAEPSMKYALTTLAVALTVFSLAACRHKDTDAPPVATPSLTLNRERAPLGSPLEMTYKFVVANDAKFDEDYRVMVHVMDADDVMIWADDHNPSVPTRQ